MPSGFGKWCVREVGLILHMELLDSQMKSLIFPHTTAFVLSADLGTMEY